MFLILGIVFLLKKYLAEAAPLSTPDAYSPETLIFSRDNSTAADGCHQRTVLDILWSCLATTFACTWVSVHPNVPFMNEGKWEILGRRIFLMIFSILAPEVMVMWAFKQWRGAVMIKNAVNGARPKSSIAEHASELRTIGEIPREIEAKKPWTTTHGHFLQMGGFSIMMAREECNRFSVYLKHIIRSDDDIVEGSLTFDTLGELLRSGLISFPAITEDEINDKSKGDALSKGVACLQLAWFIAQIITRALQGLAVTELELTTAALAGLNSAMYLFWWSKPLDVRCPIVIQTKGAQDAEDRESWAFEERSEEFSLRKYMWESVKGSFRAMMKSVAEFVQSLPGVIMSLWRELLGVPSKMAQMVKKVKQAFTRRSQNPRGRPEGDDANGGRMSESSNTALQSNRALKLKSFFRSAVKLSWDGMAFIFCIIGSPIAAVLGISDFSDIDKWDDMMSMIFYGEDAKRKPLVLFGLSAIAGALFGVVHCFAWHFTFPSHVEQIMWRSASLTVAGSCIVVFLSCWFYDAVDIAVGVDFLFIFTFGSALLYPIARICLLVLALISLRSLPPSAFDSVRWIELVPHI